MHDNIGPDGAAAIASMPNLLYTNLDNNHIGDEGAAYFANTSSLISLSLMKNGIGDNGTAALANNQHLRQLLLSLNNLTNQGAFALAASEAKYNVLFVSLNHIGPAGIEALEAKNIPILDVTGNDGSIKAMDSATSEKIAKNKFLRAYCAENHMTGCEVYLDRQFRHVVSG